MLVYFTTI